MRLQFARCPIRGQHLSLGAGSQLHPPLCSRPRKFRMLCYNGARYLRKRCCASPNQLLSELAKVTTRLCNHYQSDAFGGSYIILCRFWKHGWHTLISIFEYLFCLTVSQITSKYTCDIDRDRQNHCGMSHPMQSCAGLSAGLRL